MAKFFGFLYFFRFYYYLFAVVTAAEKILTAAAAAAAAVIAAAATVTATVHLIALAGTFLRILIKRRNFLRMTSFVPDD